MSARPRPRPRQRTKAADNAGDAPKEASTSSVTVDATTSSVLKPVPTQLNVDEDALFIRKRSATRYKRLEQLAKNRRAATPLADSGDSDAETNHSGSSPRSRKHKQENTLPSWARGNVLNILSSDEDEEQGDAQSVENLTPKANRAANTNSAKRKRQKSRSRSLTPPPGLSKEEIQRARNLVRQALETAPRPASPISLSDDDDDDSTDLTLDPELASIVQAVQRESYSRSTSAVPEQSGGPEDVIIKVKWRPHPLNDAGKSTIWAFKTGRHDPLAQLFEETADQAAVLTRSLVVTYDGRRVFSSTTPHTLGIWAEADMEACDNTTYEYIREHRHRYSPGLGPTGEEGSHRDGSPTGFSEAGSEAESSQEQDDSGDVFKLIVRSATTKDVTLSVRPTTTCGAIVKHFLKRLGLSDKYAEGTPSERTKKANEGPRLMIDGEKMDPNAQIAVADLEDGDQVEVVGL